MRITDDEIEKFYREKEEYFRYVASYLSACSFLLRLRKTKVTDEELKEEIESEPFPPTKEFFQNFVGYPRDRAAAEDNDSIEYVSDKMLNRMIWVIHGDCEKQMQKMSIKDFDKAFSRLARYCSWLADVCGSVAFERKLRKFDLLTKIEKIAYCINGKSYEVIGYWIAKSDYSKKNKTGAMVKKEKKKVRLEIIQSIIEKYPEYQRDRKQRIAFLADAMSKADVTTSRSIHNYLREIKKKAE